MSGEIGISPLAQLDTTIRLEDQAQSDARDAQGIAGGRFESLTPTLPDHPEPRREKKQESSYGN